MDVSWLPPSNYRLPPIGPLDRSKRPMTCPQCENAVERSDVPHVVRICEGCGRTLRIHEPGPHGKGLQIKKGDQVVVPADWMRLSFNPLKTNAQFSRYGLQWFAEQIHLEDLPTKKD